MLNLFIEFFIITCTIVSSINDSIYYYYMLYYMSACTIIVIIIVIIAIITIIIIIFYFISDNKLYGYNFLYKNTYYKQVKNNKNKWQSIKHETSNTYINALHWTILHREYNFTIFGSVRNYRPIHQRR